MKTNVILIMADQLRYDMIGQDTPNLKKLIDEGVMFPNAYCTSPLCAPARGSFFTGLYPNETGCVINAWEPLDKKYTKVGKGIANMYGILEKNWDSWHAGKQHFCTEDEIDKDINSKTKWTYTEKDYRKHMTEKGVRTPGGKNFKGLVPEMASGEVTRVKFYSTPETGCYPHGLENFFDGYFLEGALKAIKGRNKDKPLFLSTMFVAPHPPLEIPEPWYSMFDKVELPENIGVWYKDQSPLQMYNLPGAIGTRYTRENWEDIWKIYKGLVVMLDHCVGKIIQSLKDEGLYENSLVIFTSDHGEMLGSHCLWQKMCMYEEAVRTPFIMKFPEDKKIAEKIINKPVSGVDVLPTICDYLGLEINENISGVSLMPLIDGKDIEREPVFIQFDGNGALGNFQRCIVKDNFKLITDIFKDEIYLELYDLEEDKEETKNLIFNNKYEDIAKSMIVDLKGIMERTKDRISIPDNLYRDFIKKYEPYRLKTNLYL